MPDALLEIVKLRKCPLVFDAGLAFDRGKTLNPDLNEANRRFFLSQKDLIDRLTKPHSKSMQSFPGADDVPNPRAEEEVFTNFRELKQIEVEMPEGRKELIPDNVHAHAIAALERGRNIDYILRRILGPDPVEWFEDMSEPEQGFALEAFTDKMKNAAQALDRLQGGHDEALFLPLPDADYVLRQTRDWDGDFVSLPTEARHAALNNAVDYLWKLRSALMYAFHDYSLSYRVYDACGHEIPFPDLVTMPEHRLSNTLANSDYQIKFEHLNYSSERIAWMFFTNPARLAAAKAKLQARLDKPENQESSAYRAELCEWEKWEGYFAARSALRIHGPPHVDPDDHPWMSAARSLKEIERIRRNFKRKGPDVRAGENEIGLWEIFIANREKAEAILDACERQSRAMLERPFTNEMQRLMGYDPKGWPIQNVKYTIPVNAWVVMLDVPDALLADPLRQIDIGSHLIPVSLPHSDLQQQIAAAHGDFSARPGNGASVFSGARACHDRDNAGATLNRPL